VAYSAAHLDQDGKRAGRSGIYIVSLEDASAQPTAVLEVVHPTQIIRLRVIDWK